MKPFLPHSYRKTNEPPKQLRMDHALLLQLNRSVQKGSMVQISYNYKI